MLSRHDALPICHDLGVVSGRSDRVAVMYAGSVVETSATEELFTRPRHPYTEALMAAIPRLESPTHTVLQTIPGGLPDMTKPITGRSEEHTSELQSLMRISYAVFCLKKKK